MQESTNPPIKSTVLAFDMIESIHESDGATLIEIVDRFEKPKSTIHDHLTTLVELGYLTKEGRTYRVSLRFLNLGGKARSRTQLYQAAESEVRQLANETGEHANLMVEHDGLGIFLLKQKGPESVQLDTYDGKEVHLHTTAMGKAILAEMSDEKRRQILDRRGLPGVTENTITDRETLQEEIKTIRERGYAIDDEERGEAIRCVAAPIVTETGVAGAVSISAPSSRMAGERFEEEIPSAVCNAANIIKINIQYS